MLDKKNALLICKRNNIKTFMFKCILCEDYIYPQSGHLKNHSGKCRKCAQKKKPYEYILNELIKSCNKTNKFINIDYNDFIEIIKNSRCHYCDKLLIFNPYTRDNDSNYVSRAYQLDRKNNNLGYIKDNIVPCCWNCNRMKSNVYSYEDFIKLSPILKEINNKN